MTLVTDQHHAPSGPARTLADEQSAANFASNLHAAKASQPALVEALRELQDPDVTWLFARDKTLTCLDRDGRWRTGCSVPARTAKAQLKSLRPVGSVACFIEPPHAAHVRAAMTTLGPTQTIVCVVRDLASLRVILGCDEFSTEMESGRLWFAWGAQWDESLRRLFDEQPGFATPGQFIRINVIAEAISSETIDVAQEVFGDVLKRRAEEIQSLREARDVRASVISSRPRVLVAAPMRFRLWGDAGWTLAQTMHGAGAAILDVDDPRSAAPLALARAASTCDALVAADVTRSQMIGVVSPKIPWITWITRPTIHPASAGAPHDALILADAHWRDTALERGWRADQIHAGGWPTHPNAAATDSDAPRGEHLAMIVDTASLGAPKDRMDFSSHAVLWERIREELLRNPLALGGDVMRYLNRRMSDMEIAEEGFDRVLFVERLILPAYQQGLAMLLIDADLPLRLHGNGWGDAPRCAAHWCGPIESREVLIKTARSAAALVHCWPDPAAHPIDALGRPVLRCDVPRKESLIRAAKQILASAPPAISPSPLDSRAILRLVRA